MDAERYVTATEAAQIVGLSSDRIRKLGLKATLERVTDPRAIASVGRRPGAPITHVYRLAEVRLFAEANGRTLHDLPPSAAEAVGERATSQVALALAEIEIDRLRNEVERLRRMLRAAISDPVFDSWDEAP